MLVTFLPDSRIHLWSLCELSGRAAASIADHCPFTLQEWLNQKHTDKVSFGEEKLVQQRPEQTGSLSSILLQALQRLTIAGLVSLVDPSLCTLHKYLLKQLCANWP